LNRRLMDVSKKQFQPEQLNISLQEDNFQFLCEMDEFYLQPMLSKSISQYTRHSMDMVQDQETIQLWCLIALILGIVTIYVSVVQRLVSNLDNEVKRTRELLLMIPDDILHNVPSLQAYLIKELFGRNK